MVVYSIAQIETSPVRDFHRDRRNNNQSKDLITALKRCIKSRDLETGYKLHAEAADYGDDSNIYVSNTLINMYTKCGSLADARKLFDRMHHRDIVSWNIIVLGFAESSSPELALEFFRRMQSEGFRPNSRSYVAALKACAVLARNEDVSEIDAKSIKIKALEKTMAIHAQAASFGCESDRFVANILVDCYSNCGSVEDSSRVFDRIENPTVVSWTSLVLGFAENGQMELALERFSQMHAEKVEIDALSYVAAIKACSGLAAIGKKMISLEIAMKIHSEASTRDYLSDLYLASSLIDTYVKCGSMVDARMVFDGMKQRNVVSWNSLISGYAENGDQDVALELFLMMNLEGCEADPRTYVAVLKACTGFATREDFHDETRVLRLETGIAVHARAELEGFDSNVFVASSLIDMYVKFGILDEARRVFDRLRRPRDCVVNWNALMLGYVENGEADLALELLPMMMRESCSPNARTFVAGFKACSSLAEEELDDGVLAKSRALERGMYLHRLTIEKRLDTEAFVASSLIDLYSNCGSMDDAWRVFEKTPIRDMVLWTGLLLGYVANGEVEIALKLLESLEIDDTIDRSSIVSGLNLCAGLGSKEASTKLGEDMIKVVSLEMEFHSKARESGCGDDDEVARALVSMYSKCGAMIDARRIFDAILQLTSRSGDIDLAAWNWMIQGYAESKQPELGLDLFRRIPSRILDAQSFVAGFKACGSLASLGSGREIHALACRLGMESLLLVGNTLIDFYGKCGSILDGRIVFYAMDSIDIVSWTALMEGYSRQGDSKIVIELFDSMQEQGLEVDSIALASVFAACSHCGQLETAKTIFGSIVSKYKLVPSEDHFVCMVDLLGRANELDAAVEMVRSMQSTNRVKLIVLWRIILDTCRRWKNVDVGKIAFRCLMDMDEDNSAAYVLLASTY